MAFTYTTRKDGRLMKRISIHGKIKSIYAKDLTELKKKYAEISYLTSKDNIIQNESITVKEWSNKWLELYKSNVSSATKKMYEESIRIHINPQIGNIKLKNLKQIDIINLLNALDKKGITRRKEWTFNAIKQILQTAVENDYIYKNVTIGIKIKKHKSKEKKALDSKLIGEIQKLFKINPDAFILLFMIYTGLRRGELIPLQYKDINIEEKYILVNKAVCFVNNQPIIKKTKNEEIRKVPILNNIYDILEENKKEHKNNDYVFSNKDGKIMSETSVKRKIHTLINQLNKEYEKEQKEIDKDFIITEDNKIYFTYHQLRHTYVCLLHKAGIDLKEAQSFTGHKDINVLLNIYTHLDNEDKQNAIDKLNKYVS